MTDPNRKIRLCLAAHSFFPAYGGAQLRYLRYLPGLRQRGVETEVFSGVSLPLEDDRDRIFSPGSMLPCEEIEGTSVYRVCLPDKADRGRNSIFEQGLESFCEQDGQRPDVVQLLSKLAPSTQRLLRHLHALGIPIVYSVNIAPVEQKYGKNLGKYIKKFHKRLLLCKLYNQMDCIVTNNSQLKDMVREMGVRSRIEVIANGIDLDRFRAGRDGEIRRSVRHKLGIEASDTVICSVGALIPRKGTHLLVGAWARMVRRCPNLHLLLVGPFLQSETDLFRRHIQSVIEETGHASQVHFVGMVENVEAYLKAADVFVLPSEREGLPNSVLEAMATGLPVVITPFIGLSDDLGRAGEHYLLSQRDVDDLVMNIGRLLDDPVLRVELGRRGRLLVEETMDLRHSLDRYADLYKELARKGPDNQKQNVKTRLMAS